MEWNAYLLYKIMGHHHEKVAMSTLHNSQDGGILNENRNTRCHQS
jgi:hypothetical protein